MTTAGWWIAIVTCATLIIIFLIHPFIKKLTSRYIFWLPIGIFLSLYLIILRYIPDLSDFLALSDKKGNFLVSKVFLLDLCPFCALFLTLAMCFDKKRITFSFISPFALIGGLVTIYFEIIFQAEGSFKYIFIGEKPNSLYFMMHFILVIFGFWTLLNSRVKLLKTPIYGISFFLIYLLYVLIVSSIFAIDSNVSGIYANDWETGEYSSVKYYINLPYPGIMIVSFLLGIIFGYILVLVFWFLQNKFFGWKLVKTKKIIIPPSYYY